MALTSYTLLKSAVADWLNRTDLTSQIPDFITLFEASIRDHNAVSTQTVDATLTLNAVEVSLPSDFREPRSLYFADNTNLVYGPIAILGGPEAVEQWRQLNGLTSGRPQVAAITGGATTLRLAPTPDTSYTATLEYFAFLTPLSATVASNFLLASYPNVYLYGTLMQAESFLKNDERVTMWKAMYEQALEQLELRMNREAWGAPLVMRDTLSLG